MKICLDPGHGGHDPGAVGPTGLNESAVNLAISQFLEAELAGFEVDLTRDTETSLTLAERCECANDGEADYFISVHCNSDGSTAVGIETLYTSNTGKEIAIFVQDSLILATGDVDRGIKERNDLYVLNGTEMPSILVEVGFISHPDTEEKLATGTYQRVLAEAIANGFNDYLGSQEILAD